MAKWAFIFFCITVLISCNNKNELNQKQQILGLKEMSQFASSEFIITKLIKANDSKTWYKIGDRKILLSCTANIKAGIDLSQLDEKNIEIKNNDIKLVLPKSQILSLNILPENIKLEEEDVDLFRQHFTNSEQNDLLTQAESQIKLSADSIGITKSADENAKLFFTNFLSRLGYKHIDIDFVNASKSATIE